MNEYKIKARGKTQQTFRLTGRDGPPESFQMIPGVPAWLARGTPVQCMNAFIHECMNEKCCRCHPPEAKSKLPAARGKLPVARDRGHPSEDKYGTFHRVKLPEMGMVCAGNRDIKQLSQNHQLKKKEVKFDEK